MEKRQIAGTKGASAAGWVRTHLGGNLSDLGSVMRRAMGKGGGGFTSGLRDYLGLGSRGVSAMGRYAGRQVNRSSTAMWLQSGMAGRSGDFAQDAAAALGVGRAAGLGAAALGLGLGISATTGISVFDQAQAIAGGRIGYGAAKGLGLFGPKATNLRRAGGVGMVAGAALGGAGLSTGEWMLGGLGYGAATAAQYLMQPSKNAGVFSGMRLGGKYSGVMRAAGAGLGVGMGLLL